MRTFIAPTEDYIKLERTKLAADATAGSNVSLTLENNNGIIENIYIVIGQEGSEKAELQQVNQAVTVGQGVRVATLLFAHKAGEPVTVYRYNKRKFYGATTADGSYTELTSDGSPKTIEVDDPQGTKFEYTGTTYLYFKSTYYNSTDTVETDEDESDAVPGDQTGRYASIYGIRKMAGFTENRFINDERFEGKRTEAESEINSSIFARYALPLSEVPPLLRYVCECLAAGYLHFEEYGPEGDAVKKLGEGRGILNQIKKGTQILLDSNLQELTRSGATVTTRLDGRPNGTETCPEHQRKFSVGQKF